MVAVGVALRSGDVVHVDHKRAVALEDILIFFQFLHHGGQRGMKFHGRGLSILHIANRDVVFLGLDIQQAVDGNTEVVSPDAAVMDGDANVFLLLRGLVEQRLHIVFQKPIILYDDGNNRNEDADDKRPIQEQEEKLKIEGRIEDDAYREEIADSDEEYQSDNDTGMMPYTPGLYSLRQTVKDCPSIESIATRSDKAKDGCRHALIALIGTESEWLQQIEYRPYDYTI